MSTSSLKIGDLVKIRPIIQKLVNEELPIKAAFRLGRIAKSLEGLYNSYEENRVKLVHKYGVESEDKKTKSVPPEKMSEFQGELAQLLEEKVELGFEALPISLLADKVELTTVAAVALVEAGIIKDE